MSEIHGASGSYVIHALEAFELDEFEAHLAECDTCTHELVEFRETASELSLLSTATPPPPLKTTVMAAINEVRVLPPHTPQAPHVPDQLAHRRQPRTTRILLLAVAAVLATAVGLGGWVTVLVQHQTQTATATIETQLLQAPDLKAYTIDLKDGGKATIIASKSQNRALFSSADLPTLKPGQTYQLWTVSGPLTAPTRVTPDAPINGNHTIKQWFTGPINHSDALGISIEQTNTPPTGTNMQAATAL